MANKQPRGLGRGLSALLGDMGTELERQPVGYINKEIAPKNPVRDTGEVFRIPVSEIIPNPFQPRKSFDHEALEELADSIRTLGLIQPITVRHITDDRYQIISGERRFRACTLAGMDLIPAYVREADDQGMLEMAIVENVQRTDLDPIEIAMSYSRLIEECNLTQEQMARRVGKNRASVANYLRLLKLPAKIQHDLKVGLLSVGHAKVLLGVDDPKVQEALCEAVINNELSVRQLEERVRKLALDEGQKVQSEALPDNCSRLIERLGKFFDSNISLKRTPAGKGTLTIKFRSDEELDRLLKALDEKDI